LCSSWRLPASMSARSWSPSGRGWAVLDAARLGAAVRAAAFHDAPASASLPSVAAADLSTGAGVELLAVGYLPFRLRENCQMQHRHGLP
jgi:hypothetical protein